MWWLNAVERGSHGRFPAATRLCTAPASPEDVARLLRPLIGGLCRRGCDGHSCGTNVAERGQAVRGASMAARVPHVQRPAGASRQGRTGSKPPVLGGVPPMDRLL